MSENARVYSALSGCLTALMFSTAASAATTGFDDLDLGSGFGLADIVAVDPLGYACIVEDQIDLAFHATGKGMRLPRTCLPEPCRAALSQFELASLIGRPAFEHEWDDYVSRYADHCRKEIVPFEEEAEDVDEPADEAVAFWTPLVGTYPANAPIRRSFPTGTVTDRPGGIFPGAGRMPGLGPTTGSNWTGTERSFPGPFPDPDDPERGTPPVDQKPPPLPDPRDDPETLPPVPLPGGLALLVSGLACLLLGRRYRKA